MKNLKTADQLYENKDSDTDRMSDAEVKEEVLTAIKNLRKNTNQWAARDILKQFTSWGFWSGSEMASIDIPIANKIADELLIYVKELGPGENSDVEDVYDKVHHWAN